MQTARRRTARARLLSRQAEIADEDWFRRIAQIVNLRHPWGAPAHHSRYQVGDSRVAFPPALVRIPQTAHDDVHARGFGRIADIPHFVRGVAEAAQHIELALFAMRQIVAAAYAHHL